MPSWISEENLQKALNNGISYHTLYDRIRSGWTIKEAITTPPVRGGIFTKEEREISESNIFLKPSRWQYNAVFKIKGNNKKKKNAIELKDFPKTLNCHCYSNHKETH